MKTRIADNSAFCCFPATFIPPVNRKRPRQPRQQICRAGVRVPQLTNTDRRFSISAQALRRQLQAVMSRSAAVANHSSEPGHDAVFGTERRLRTVEHRCRPVVQPVRHAARLPHAKRHKWQTDGCRAQPVLCRDIRFQFYTGGSAMGSLGPG